ncbi:MAG: hypothetical protein JWR72_2207 [Flavisolibacter sp.]|jgi:hypothetical protein|nr:hypothetical protein [Flavisolibacter sp.]
MSNQKNIQDELNSLESGLTVNNDQVFSVPEGYFEGFASSLLAKVKASEVSAQTELAELSPLLAGIPKVTPYSVPFFYFEQNAALIPDFSEDPQLSFLSEIGKAVVPYKIPQGYFDTLPEQIVSKVTQPMAKVVPLFARKWMRMVAAAVVGGILFVGGYQYFNDKPPADLAGNSSDTTQNFVAQNAPAIEQEIRKTSTKELDEFIKNVGINVKTAKAETSSSGKDNAKELLKDVSDTEMEAFLSALPTTDELFVTD